jgi:membrane-bound lytic murein transglycosylase D
LTRYTIPLQLAYLPHVESSFNPYAYSKVGAAGLWQFMRGTGRLYLKINYYVDERRDPIASTYAAAKLLSHNYSVLQSWPLAITAYNHGLYGMKRAVATTGSRDIAVVIQRHKSRTFKFASKNFYSCFLAVCDIAPAPEKYFRKVEYHTPVAYTDIILTHYIRASVLARFLNVDVKTLASLNPAVRPVVFVQDKHIPSSTRIHLPGTVALAYADSALGAIPDSLKADKPPRPKYYRVSRGDNLYAIARRFGISARDLAYENDISRMNRIYAGQVLRIPGIAKKAEAPIVSFVEDKRRKTRLASRVSRPEKEAAGLEKTSVPEPPLEQLPDSLEEIVMARAESEPEALSGVQGGHQGRFDAEVYDLNIELSVVGDAASIRVTIDETIGHYADWLKIPAWRIRQLNRMGNRSTIRIGQRLTIPGDSASIELFVQKRLEYHMALEEDFYSQYKVADVRERIVSRGENLWDICHDDTETPLWLLKKYNKHTDISRLMPGMRLWLPIVTEKTSQDYEEEKLLQGGGYPYYTEPIQAPDKPLRRRP